MAGLPAVAGSWKALPSCRVRPPLVLLVLLPITYLASMTIAAMEFHKLFNWGWATWQP